jgi:hypothetical protein
MPYKNKKIRNNIVESLNNKYLFLYLRTTNPKKKEYTNKISRRESFL